MPIVESSQQESHTLSEILSQPEIWPRALQQAQASQVFSSAAQRMQRAREVLFLGCGTSFYLAEAAAATWTLTTGKSARALPASELILFPALAQLRSNGTYAVVISRSGRTSEAIRAAQTLKGEYKIPTLGITCTTGSELARSCELTLELTAADEKSTVMTRSFTSMLLALQQLAASCVRAQTIEVATQVVSRGLTTRIRGISERIESFAGSRDFADYVFLAQGPFYSIAREAGLKVMEMSCAYGQPYHSLEFRHGPKAIVGPETCLTFFLSETGYEAEAEVLSEMKELGGTIVAVCNHGSDAVRKSSDLVIELGMAVPEIALLAPYVVPAQLLGYHSGIKEGLNPDEPRNLSRVVILD